MRGLLRSILYLWSVAFGLLCAAAWMWPGFVELVAHFLATNEGRLVLAVFSALFLTSPLLILLRWVHSIRRNREISYQTDNGKVSVSLIAIEEALTRAIEGEPEVRKAHVRVFEDRVRRAVVIEAVVTMWEVPNVTDRNRFLQKMLRRRFAELMPEQTTVDVNLHLHRMTERTVEANKPSVARTQTAPVSNEPELGTGSGGQPSTDRLGRGKSEDEPAAHPANAQVEPTEDDLYVGPTYPVGDDEDDDGSRALKAVPKHAGNRAGGKPPKGS
jgi:hypothetical protein